MKMICMFRYLSNLIRQIFYICYVVSSVKSSVILESCRNTFRGHAVKSGGHKVSITFEASFLPIN